MTSRTNTKKYHGVHGSAGSVLQLRRFDHQIERDYLDVYTDLVRQLGRPQAMAHLARSVFTVAIGGNDIILRAAPPTVAVELPPAELQVLPPQPFVDLLAQTLERQLQVCTLNLNLQKKRPA